MLVENQLKIWTNRAGIAEEFLFHLKKEFPDAYYETKRKLIIESGRVFGHDNDAITEALNALYIDVYGRSPEPLHVLNKALLPAAQQLEKVIFHVRGNYQLTYAEISVLNHVMLVGGIVSHDDVFADEGGASW